MFHFWRCVVFSVLVMEAVSVEDASQSTSIAATSSKPATSASTTATPTTQDIAKSAPPASAPKPEIVDRTAPTKEDGQSSRSLSVHSTTVEPGHSNEPAVVKGKMEQQPIVGSTADHAPSIAHQDDGAELPHVIEQEAEDAAIDVQRVSYDDPTVPSISELSPRCLAIVGALVSFTGVVSYSFVVLYYIFKSRWGTSKLQKPARKAPEIKQSSQLEDLEAAYDMADRENDLLPSSSVVRKSVHCQQSHEAEEDPSGWENDAASDADWQNDSWCNDDWSDAEVSETCQAISDEMLEAAIVAGRSAKPSSNGLSLKGKAD